MGEYYRDNIMLLVAQSLAKHVPVKKGYCCRLRFSTCPLTLVTHAKAKIQLTGYNPVN